MPGNYQVTITVEPNLQWIGTFAKDFNFTFIARPEEVKEILEIFDKHINKKIDLEIEG